MATSTAQKYEEKKGKEKYDKELDSLNMMFSPIGVEVHMISVFGLSIKIAIIESKASW